MLNVGSNFNRCALKALTKVLVQRMLRGVQRIVAPCACDAGDHAANEERPDVAVQPRCSYCESSLDQEFSIDGKLDALRIRAAGVCNWMSIDPGNHAIVFRRQLNRHRQRQRQPQACDQAKR